MTIIVIACSAALCSIANRIRLPDADNDYRDKEKFLVQDRTANDLEYQPMKSIFGSKKDLISYSFAAILLGSASMVSAASTNSEAVFQTPNGISYVSGGVGSESIDRLSSMAREFNLKLVFAMKTGEYVSDVGVIIADAKGNVLLDTTAEGPWFFTRLPTGHYQIAVSFAGKVFKQQIALETGKIRTLDFRWTSE